MTTRLNKNIVADTVRRPANILILLFLLLAIGAGCLVHAWLTARYDFSRLKTREQLCLEHSSYAVLKEFDSIRKDLIFISQVPELQICLNEPDNHFIKQQISEGLTAFVKSKKIFDQVRYINETGQEVIRVDFNNGNPAIVPESGLQNKAKRYYFSDTMELDHEDIYFSPIDLNVEHGKIELPYKPMLRIATPLFDDKGNRKGIFILNLLVKYLPSLDSKTCASPKSSERV